MTIFIILITVVVSYMGFQRSDVFYKLMFNSYQIWHRRQWYRMISHGLLHVDWPHLLINMFVLFSFGSFVELRFDMYETAGMVRDGKLIYLLFYISAIAVSSVLSLYKNRDKYHYNSVGASGAVSAIVFSSIITEPFQYVYFFGLLPIPGWLFGVSYLVYSWYMSKKGGDYINHDAHFVGAVYGILFTLLIQPQLIMVFFQRM